MKSTILVFLFAFVSYHFNNFAFAAVSSSSSASHISAQMCMKDARAYLVKNYLTMDGETLSKHMKFYDHIESVILVGDLSPEEERLAFYIQEIDRQSTEFFSSYCSLARGLSKLESTFARTVEIYNEAWQVYYLKIEKRLDEVQQCFVQETKRMDEYVAKNDARLKNSKVVLSKEDQNLLKDKFADFTVAARLGCQAVVNGNADGAAVVADYFQQVVNAFEVFIQKGE